MEHIHITEDIVPLSEFKTHASRIIQRLGETGRAIVITLNGRAGAVLMAPEDFDRYQDYRCFLDGIRAGVADADAGRTLDSEEVRRHIDTEFGADNRA